MDSLLLEYAMESEVFQTRLEELPHILDWVRTHLKKTSLSPKYQMHLELAIEEAVVNIIYYAKAPNLTFKARTEPHQIEFELIDAGAPFNPLEQPQSEIDLPLEERAPGGLGVHLMRKCVDTILYRREDNTNILTLVKKLE